MPKLSNECKFCKAFDKVKKKDYADDALWNDSSEAGKLERRHQYKCAIIGLEKMRVRNGRSIAYTMTDGKAHGVFKLRYCPECGRKVT